MNPHIEKIDAQEILDSRGNPTVRVNVYLDNGVIGTASAGVLRPCSKAATPATRLRWTRP